MNGGLASNSKRTLDRTGSAPDRSTTVLDVSASQGARRMACPSGLQVISPESASATSITSRLFEVSASTIDVSSMVKANRVPLGDQTGMVGRSSILATCSNSPDVRCNTRIDVVGGSYHVCPNRLYKSKCSPPGDQE